MDTSNGTGGVELQAIDDDFINAVIEEEWPSNGEEPKPKRIIETSIYDQLKMADYRERGSLIRRMADAMEHVRRYTESLTENIKQIQVDQKKIFKTMEINSLNEALIGAPGYEWRGISITGGNDPSSLLSQIISFNIDKTEVKYILDNEKEMFDQIIPASLNDYGISGIVGILETGREALLAYLAQKYISVADEETLRTKIIIKDGGSEKEVYAIDFVSDINEGFQKQIKSRVLKSGNINDVPLLTLIPENPKLLFSNILNTYWRLSTFILAMYITSDPYPYSYTYTSITRDFVSAITGVSVRPSYLLASPSPNMMHKQMFSVLFPGNSTGAIKELLGRDN